MKPNKLPRKCHPWHTIRITAKRINLLHHRIRTAQAQKKHTEPMARSAYADFSESNRSSNASSRLPFS